MSYKEEPNDEKRKVLANEVKKLILDKGYDTTNIWLGVGFNRFSKYDVALPMVLKRYSDGVPRINTRMKSRRLVGINEKDIDLVFYDLAYFGVFPSFTPCLAAVLYMNTKKPEKEWKMEVYGDKNMESSKEIARKLAQNYNVKVDMISSQSVSVKGSNLIQ